MIYDTIRDVNNSMVTTFQPGCCTRVVLPFTQLEERGRNLCIPCNDFAVIVCLQAQLWKQGRSVHYCSGSFLSPWAVARGALCCQQRMEGWAKCRALNKETYISWRNLGLLPLNCVKQTKNFPSSHNNPNYYEHKGLKAPRMLHFPPASSFVRDFRELSQ